MKHRMRRTIAVIATMLLAPLIELTAAAATVLIMSIETEQKR